MGKKILAAVVALILAGGISVGFLALINRTPRDGFYVFDESRSSHKAEEIVSRHDGIAFTFNGKTNRGSYDNYLTVFTGGSRDTSNSYTCRLDGSVIIPHREIRIWISSGYPSQTSVSLFAEDTTIEFGRRSLIITQCTDGAEIIMTFRKASYKERQDYFKPKD